MKIFVLGFAFLAVGCAVAELLPSNEYLPPVEEIEGPVSSGGLADDGYRYKTVRRFRVRRRRDVNELPSAEYLPPVQQVGLPQLGLSQAGLSQVGLSQIAPSSEYLAPLAQAAPISQISSGILADDGYRYKTVRRLRTRHRRDVNELPSAEYLPPVQSLGLSQIAPSSEYLAPLAPAPQIAQISSGVLADDGYRYKTVRRFRTRHRRDVNELPSAEYLPPVQSLGLSQIAPSSEYLAPLAPAPQIAQISSGVLADDGYRYKTVRRFRTRHRRDVNELPSAEYLPPVQSLGLSQIAPSSEYLAPLAPAPQIAQISSGVLADDGYRYKTVRRLRTRHRRDVNELPSAEYLPPVQSLGLSQISPILPSSQYLSPIDIAPLSSNILSGALADDGYRYRTVKKIKRRH